MTLESLGVEPTGDLEMVEAIRQEVRRLCQRDAIVSHILLEDQAVEYKSDYKRHFTTETEQAAPAASRAASRATKVGSRAVSRATSDSSRGWDPILAGYHARERMSRAPTPGDLVMRRSFLPMDLNSTSSENSEGVNMEKWDEFSEDSENEEGSGNELDHDEARGEMENERGEADLPKNVEEKSDSAARVATSQGSTSRSRVEFSEDQGVVSTLPSYQAEENGDQDSNSETLFELESNKDDPELLELADGISERNITSPGPSDIVQLNANAGDLGSSIVSSQGTVS